MIDCTGSYVIISSVVLLIGEGKYLPRFSCEVNHLLPGIKTAHRHRCNVENNLYYMGCTECMAYTRSWPREGRVTFVATKVTKKAFSREASLPHRALCPAKQPEPRAAKSCPTSFAYSPTLLQIFA